MLWAAGALQHRLAQMLLPQLPPHLPPIAVQVLAQCPSTNSELVERARVAGAAFVPCLLVAEQQTQGRGRLGRAWAAAAGSSLTFSLALPLAPQSWLGLSLAVGLALAEALEPNVFGLAGPRVALKWPNDLWLADAAGGRKLGGILIETVGAGPRRLCVVGVGLNVLPLPPALAAGLGREVACLQEFDDRLTAPATLARIAPPLVSALSAFEREGFAPLVARYAARDALRGHPVDSSAPLACAGVAEGVDADGALLLRDGRGALRRILSGEVSVRRRPADLGAAVARAG